MVRMTRKVNRSVLESLSEMSVRHIEVEPTVKRYLSEKDLELPVLSGLTLNAIKSSCGSSTVSLTSSNDNSLKRYLCDRNNRNIISQLNILPITWLTVTKYSSKKKFVNIYNTVMTCVFA